MSSIREVYLTNSEVGKKEKLETLNPGKLTMYACGPTVYGFIHIGNLRAALVQDSFFRYFRHIGYDVNYVRNYTDIDDKIIKRAVEEKIPVPELTKKYTQEVEKDFALAGMLQPTRKTLATEHIPEMIQMIEKLIQNGHAYVVDGEVLFSVESFKDYGKLSGRDLDDLLAGARVEINENKKNPLDFALWKPAKEGEPFWESPWGKGRPGWHIECSVMSSKWLGNKMDLHFGGTDLIFPHHENEIAQTEGATGEKPFVRYWIHNAFLTIDQEKMSKSIGNVFLARDFLEKFGGEMARYLILSVHHRSLMDFSSETVDGALGSLQRIYEAKLKAVELKKKMAKGPDIRAEGLWGSFVQLCEKTKGEIEDHFANDLNTPGALGALFTLIREMNRILGEPMAVATPAAHLGASAFLEVLEGPIGEVIGIGRADPKKVLANLDRVRASRPATGGKARPEKEEIEKLIEERKSARKSKDFSRADEIRKDLLERGVEIKDGPEGTTWSYR